MAGEFLTDKLDYHPLKLTALQAGGFDITYPIVAELSLTNACNLNCGWCSDVELRNRLGGNMKMKVLDVLFRDLSQGGTKGITIEGGGEPTIWRDGENNINQVIQSVRSNGMAPGLITNGVEYNYPETLKMLEWCRISLDFATPEQMIRLKGKDFAQKVMKNLEDMGKAKENTTLGAAYIVTKHNIEGTEDLVKKLRDFGLDYIQFKPVVDHPEMVAPNVDMIEALRKYETDSFKVYTNSFGFNTPEGNLSLPCNAHSVSTVISADGSVYLCGRLNIDETWPAIGNINQKTFNQIWFGEERKKQSQIVEDGHFCGNHCPSCRLTKYNVALKNGDIQKPEGQKTVNFL
jgi:radical SAM protein with 4Fe4S-binding SPASM domain